MPKPTPSQTVGPFFARELLWKDGGTILFPGRNDRITLTGRVLDGDGAPIFDALFETWQADSTGAFPSGHDGARPYGYGRVSTDTDGRYAIETVLPGSFKGPGGETYAPQISVAIFARGLLKALHTSGLRPLPQHILSWCSSSYGCGSACSRYRHSSPMYWNSVHSQRTTSLQNWRAENLSRITTEPPPTRTAPVASTPPTL